MDKSLDFSEPLLTYLWMILPLADARVKEDEPSSRRRCWGSGVQPIGLCSIVLGAYLHMGSPLPCLSSWPSQMVGAGKCSRAIHTLVYFERPPVSFPAWGPCGGHRVSADRTQQACPFPSLPCGLHPMTSHILTPSPGTSRVRYPKEVA